MPKSRKNGNEIIRIKKIPVKTEGKKKISSKRFHSKRSFAFDSILAFVAK
jgi:hypothetical protein